MDRAQPSARIGRPAAIVLSFLAGGILTLTVSLLLLRAEGIHRRAVAALTDPPPQPHGARFELRQVLLQERDAAAMSGRLADAAALNGHLSHEALLRALALHQDWLKRRHDGTDLYRQSADRPEWNYRNTAADFFCFHLHGALQLNRAAMPSLHETLDAEALLRTEQNLCFPVRFDTAQPVDVDHDELLFGSSEYAKDGLVSVYERHGPDLIGERFIRIVDAVMEASRHESPFGPIPGTGAEINGNMLQVCGRLSYVTGRPEYAEFAARIADAMIEKALPANAGLPPKFFDYEKNKVIEASLKLKDHGNEAVLGLAEAYAMAVARRDEDPRWRDRANRWGPPIAKMLNIILEHGVNEEGLLMGSMQPSPPRPDSSKLCDNWGYILVGGICFTDAARRDGKIDKSTLAAIEQGIDRIANSVFARSPARPWSVEGGMDADADAVESALYMAGYRPTLREAALRWADEQVDMMFEQQKLDGSVLVDYLDGNFIRTSLMYADARSGGWRVQPWREDVRVGFAVDASGRVAVSVACGQPYEGRLVPDYPRHRTLMKLPWNWARLNSWPEWYIPAATTTVESVAVPVAQGIPIALPAHGAATFEIAATPSGG